MRPVKANRANIKKAAEIIKSGGIAAFPTETVYGLGADALNPSAVASIFEVKNRPFFDPLIVHAACVEEAVRLIKEFGKRAELLAGRFWPGPLTMIFPKSAIIPDIVTAGLTTVAIRVPDNKTALELIRESETPIAAPSANPFGYISPTTAGHVYEQLKDMVDIILDGGECRVGIESTILKMDARLTILRLGGVTPEEIEEAVGEHVFVEKGDRGPEAPGAFPSHYSPRTPLVIVDNPGSLTEIKGKAGFLAYKEPQRKLPFNKIETLSKKGDLREAAANFFSCLHRLDSAGLDVIYAEAVPETGIGRAIMERLNKAEHFEKTASHE